MYLPTALVLFLAHQSHNALKCEKNSNFKCVFGWLRDFTSKTKINVFRPPVITDGLSILHKYFGREKKCFPW